MSTLLGTEAPTTETPTAATTETPTTEAQAPVTDPAAEAPKEEAAPEAAPEFVPLTADNIQFPEGIEVDEGVRDLFLDVLNDQELSPADRAQALVDLHVQMSQATSETSSQAWADLQESWQNEVRNDPDIGGHKLEGHLSNIGKVLDQYGTPELRAVMDQTGAGNNIHVVKFLANLAKDVTEGSYAQGMAAPVSEMSAAERMFPSMAKG